MQTAAQPNITSLGTLTGLNVTGAATLSDTLTVSGTGDHSFAGNVGIGTTSVSSGVVMWLELWNLGY